MKVAVVGATGLVGTRMLQLLEEKDFPVTELLPVASARSVGRKVAFRGKEWTVMSAEDAIAAKPALALFSAGGGTSAELAPMFAAAGCRVVDNSSFWRMDPDKKLVVPEINGDVLTADDWIIANPNCSTIQMVLPLDPIHKKLGIKRIVVSTYQSVTGTGYKAINQMNAERAGKAPDPQVYPYPIDQNILPHIDSFMENGYTKEEMKMVNETKKILRDESIAVTATTVRVPVQGGHSNLQAFYRGTAQGTHGFRTGGCRPGRSVPEHIPDAALRLGQGRSIRRPHTPRLHCTERLQLLVCERQHPQGGRHQCRPDSPSAARKRLPRE